MVPSDRCSTRSSGTGGPPRNLPGRDPGMAVMPPKKEMTLHIRLTPPDLEAVDDWQRANGAVSRSGAIRRLLRIALNDQIPIFGLKKWTSR